MTTLKGKYEKHVIRVGLSADRPLAYDGSEEKYALADLLAGATATGISFEKSIVEFELQTTSDAFFQTYGRGRCHRFIDLMPDAALPEVEAELAETYQHYLSLGATEEVARLSQREPEVKATVIEQIRT